MSQIDLKFASEQNAFGLTDDFDESGFKNENLLISSDMVLSNIKEVQQNNNVMVSDSLVDSMGACSLDIEMETGTGKTYVYIKTMFELNKRYGWSKFIVVVPSIAIREGVKKSFESSPNLCVNSSFSYVVLSTLLLSSRDLTEWSLVYHNTLSYQRFYDLHSIHYDHLEGLHQLI